MTLMSVLNLTCLMGYIVAYIVYMKTMIPTLLLLFWTEDELPDFLIGKWGEVFWATIYSFCMLFPMSIPREVNALRYSYLFGVICSTYIMFTVLTIFYTNNELVPSPRKNF